jgi:hypothetical protein
MKKLSYLVWALALAGLVAEFAALGEAWALYRACSDVLSCVLGWIR